MNSALSNSESVRPRLIRTWRSVRCHPLAASLRPYACLRSLHTMFPVNLASSGGYMYTFPSISADCRNAFSTSMAFVFHLLEAAMWSAVMIVTLLAVGAKVEGHFDLSSWHPFTQRRLLVRLEPFTNLNESTHLVSRIFVPSAGSSKCTSWNTPLWLQASISVARLLAIPSVCVVASSRVMGLSLLAIGLCSQSQNMTFDRLEGNGLPKNWIAL